MPLDFTSETISDPTQYGKKDWYRGSENLKKSGVQTHFTKEMIREAKRCANDIEYFSEKYVYITDIDKGVTKFKARSYQKKFWKLIKNNRFVISKQGRQAGKTAAIVGFCLHYAIFNKKRNIGVAAQNVKQARQIIARLKSAYEQLPPWLQVGVSEWQKGSVILGNGTRIFASSSNGDALRGEALSLLILDEFAHLKADEDFMESTFPVVSSGKRSKIVIISTPNGMGNAFHEIWIKSEKNLNNFKTFTVKWQDVPRPGYENNMEQWKKDTIGDIGKRRFNQEYAVEFVGSSNTLVDGDKIELMLDIAPEPIFEDKEYKAKIYVKPIENNSYVITADVGRGYGNDYSTFSVWNVTTKPYTQVVTFRDNEISTKLFPYVIYKYAKLYNDAFVVVESNDAGGEVSNILYYEIEYTEMFVDTESSVLKTGLWTSKRVKRIGTSNLRDMIDCDQIVLNDTETIKELRTFEGNKQGIYNAKKGSFDDCVQNCWLFTYALDTEYIQHFLSEITTTSELTQQKKIEKIMSELPAIGVINGATSTEKDSERIARIMAGMETNSGYDITTD